jgi:hypothetical protein
MKKGLNQIAIPERRLIRILPFLQFAHFIPCFQADFWMPFSAQAAERG